MKRVFLGVLVSMLAFVFIGCATPMATIVQEKSLQKIEQFEGQSKSDLYKRSLFWAAKTYNSANDVVQYKDEEAGRIVCKGMGSFSDALGFSRAFSYTMIIEAKDGKLRTSYENVASQRIGDVAGPDMAYNWDDVKKSLVSLQTSLYSSINSTKKDDNW